MKYLIVVTTAFTPERQALTRVCVDHLCYQVLSQGYQATIAVVCQSGNADFERWRGLGITKINADVNAKSIAGKLNASLPLLEDHVFFVNIHDDMLIHDPQWLDTFTDLFESDPCCGEIGLLAHSVGQRIDCGEHEKLPWADGVFFTSAKNMRRFGKFDESFLEDCEMQDYCYRMAAEGLTNYRLKTVPHIHGSAQFKDKINNDKARLEGLVRTRQTLKDRWKNTKIKGTEKLVWA